MRIRFLSKCFASSLLVVFIFFGAIEDSLADKGGVSLDGSWIVHVIPNAPGPPPFKNLATIFSNRTGGNQSGTFINSDPATGGGHGVWVREGNARFRTKFLTFVPDNPLFLPDTTITVMGTINVDPGGDTASGAFVTELSDPSGVYATFDGITEFERIKIEE